MNNECRPDNENKVIMQLETKNGIHIITTPFDKSQFNKAFQIDIQTDNPINLYIPDNTIPKFEGQNEGLANGVNCEPQLASINAC